MIFAAVKAFLMQRLYGRSDVRLAEDIGRRRTWLTILLANSPVIARLVFGS